MKSNISLTTSINVRFLQPYVKEETQADRVDISVPLVAGAYNLNAYI
jgi:hypothetical protein